MPDDASIFSHEYRRASTLSDVLNRVLLMLKKQARGIAVEESTTEQEQLVSIAAAVLANLVDHLAEPAQPLHREREAIVLPIELVERLRADRGGDLTYFVDDLRRASAALASGEVDDATLRTLDAVTAAADVEASRVFRRMIRS